jgi:hypothetical protein
MAAKNETIFRLPLNAPCGAGATLFSFLFPIGHILSRFSSQRATLDLKTGFAFRRSGFESLGFSSKSFPSKVGFV